MHHFSSNRVAAYREVSWLNNRWPRAFAESRRTVGSVADACTKPASVEVHKRTSVVHRPRLSAVTEKGGAV